MEHNAFKKMYFILTMDMFSFVSLLECTQVELGNHQFSSVQIGAGWSGWTTLTGDKKIDRTAEETFHVCRMYGIFPVPTFTIDLSQNVGI